MEITYDYYRIFYYVAKYKSFSRAAEALMSNQPNITKFISNLEHQLGCRLFIRSNRGVTLTPEGKKLYAHVSVAYSHLHSAELELASDTSLQNGTITIGTSETALYGILLEVLNLFHTRYPGIRLHILSYSTPQAIQALKNGLIDMAVITTPATIQKPLKQIVLKTYHEILVGSPQYAFLADKPIHLSELASYPLISLVRETSTYTFYSRFYQKHHLAFSPEIEAATASQILPMITHGLGIGFVPEAFRSEKNFSEEQLLQLPLIEKIPPREIILVEDANRPMNIAANALSSMLRNHASPA